MKKLILASLLIGSSAFADTTLFNCVVPSQSNSVKATLVMADDQSADFITVNLVEKKGTTQFYTQGDKGTLTAQIEQGFLQFMAMTEQTGQTAEGVIVNTGFLALSKDDTGAFSGFLTAKGNIYPLSCTK
ncbi:hypothetical protein [Bdellovibrio svalbardensis]|uniref:Uncharacterized protein n=1 Tax=Bdellovibrio svalbardensis TaxID=2972972 RepID=A0ABT6DJN1_9BACT|nr:hypothetical protein [Bdellovibrio svalbardensis]MDG0817050.1 hypothetical protein [Bdellovibrio svalbardensis]